METSELLGEVTSNGGSWRHVSDEAVEHFGVNQGSRLISHWLHRRVGFARPGRVVDVALDLLDAPLLVTVKTPQHTPLSDIYAGGGHMGAKVRFSHSLDTTFWC